MGTNAVTERRALDAAIDRANSRPSSRILQALIAALRFAEGFEDDQSQAGIDVLLGQLRGAIQECNRSALAPAIVRMESDAEKTCTRCREDWPADTEFFRHTPSPENPARLAAWCRACETDQKREARAAR